MRIVKRMIERIDADLRTFDQRVIGKADKTLDVRIDKGLSRGKCRKTGDGQRRKQVSHCIPNPRQRGLPKLPLNMVNPE